MYRDDSAHTPDPHHSLVSETHHPGDALMVQGGDHENHRPLAIPAPTLQPTQDVLRGGMDANTFIHALRRRWLLALCMGTVIGGLASLGLWWGFPESSSATALFEVRNEQQSLIHDTSPHSVQDFDILKKTQLALLKQKYVLSSAIRDPGIASLSILAGERDKEGWLQDHLEVEFPQNGEILSISLTGSPPEDLKALIDAVAQAYKKEVLAAEKQRKQGTRELLNTSLQDLNKDIKRKYVDYIDIAKNMGKQTGDKHDPKTDLILHDIADLQKKKDDLTSMLYSLQTDYMVGKSELSDPGLFDSMAEELIQKDTQYLLLQQQLAQALAMQMQSSGTSKKGARGGGSDPMVDAINRHIEEYKKDFKKRTVHDIQSKPNLPLQQLTKRYQMNFASVKQQLDQTTAALTKKMEELSKQLEISVELETQGDEIKQMQEVQKDMTVKLEGLDIDLNAPDQIRQIGGEAVVTKNINTTEHYAIAGLGGIAGFGLTCLGIAYLEFRHRKLNAPSDMDEGLGIRVVGVLPGLSSRKALDSTHPIVAQLTDSIDGVRTVLMHDSTSKRRQIVVVTSAATMEGRTTVASQLAASLARAGRRTLLVDGDLRRPALHSLFDVPLEDGLCEVLRAEVDAADVIRPTHAEGLWLLTAGYCDVDAIHALATEQMQPVFDKLRTEYDFIIIDGAPILGMSDALIFGQYSDGAILSVRRDHSQMPKINHSIELLRGVGIRIIGAVVNGVQAKADSRVVQMRLFAPKSERDLQPSA